MNPDSHYAAAGSGISVFAWIAAAPPEISPVIRAVLATLSTIFVSLIVPIAVAYLREWLKCRVAKRASTQCPQAGRLAALEKAINDHQ